METDKLKAAVIGVGYLGKFHAEKYSNSELSQLIAVCDTNKEQGESVAKKLDVKYVDVIVCTKD